MNDTPTEKACFKCGLVKPITEYYKHPQMGDGHLGKCKDCAKLDVTQNRRRKLSYYLNYDKHRYYNNPERRSAILKGSGRYATAEKTLTRRKTTWAIKSGKLTRPDACDDCGKKHPRIECHHEDYSDPLNVAWLCPVCHGRRHRTVKLPEHMDVEDGI